MENNKGNYTNSKDVLDFYETRPKWFEQQTWECGDEFGRWEPPKPMDRQKFVEKIEKAIVNKIITPKHIGTVPMEKVKQHHLLALTSIFYKMATEHPCDYAMVAFYYVSNAKKVIRPMMKMRFSPVADKYELELAPKRRKKMGWALEHFIGTGKDIQVYRLGHLGNHIVFVEPGNEIMMKEDGESLIYWVKDSHYTRTIRLRDGDTSSKLEETEIKASDYKTIEPTEVINLDRYIIPQDVLNLRSEFEEKPDVKLEPLVGSPLKELYSSTYSVEKFGPVLRGSIRGFLHLENTIMVDLVISSIASVILEKGRPSVKVFSYVDETGQLRYIMMTIDVPLTNSVLLVDLLDTNRDAFMEYLTRMEKAKQPIYHYKNLPRYGERNILSHHKDLLVGYTGDWSEADTIKSSTFKFKNLSATYNAYDSAKQDFDYPFEPFKIVNGPGFVEPNKIITDFETIDVEQWYSQWAHQRS